ncbi:hypothetical protein, partial [Paraburkholderia caribensis]
RVGNYALFDALSVTGRKTIAREAKEAERAADKAFMHKQDIQDIVDAAYETADSIVGARAWKTAEDASAMHDVIFWEMLARQLPGMTVADLLAILKEE